MVTYAIFGMMEYVLSLPVGASHFPVHFTGGRLSGYGIRPATFSTEDILMQGMIEKSTAFRSGKIKRLKR